MKVQVCAKPFLWTTLFLLFSSSIIIFLFVYLAINRPRTDGVLPYGGQEYKKIREDCLNSGQLFIDPQFTKFMALYDFDDDYDEDNYGINKFFFLRPPAINKNATFFVNGSSRFDVEQDEVDNLWFAAALASLTLNQHLFDNVVPKDNSFTNNYTGMFHFRFWQYGEWVDVVVDDRLPGYHTYLKNLQSSVKHEFWSSLLEKAYAKVRGSYDALFGGEPEEALVDFTGGICETFYLADKTPPTDLFEKLKLGFENGVLLAANAYDDDSWDYYETGLTQEHSYSIVDVMEVKYTLDGRESVEQLLKLRDPYDIGDFPWAEWNGDWSDRSGLWNLLPDDTLKKLEFRAKRDGEFWMSYNDFYKYFTAAIMLHVPIPQIIDNDSLHTDTTLWDLESFEGEWSAESLGGSWREDSFTYHNNPKHWITVKPSISASADDDIVTGNKTINGSAVFIGLMQKFRRENMLYMLPIGIDIYKLVQTSIVGAEFFKTTKPIANLEEPGYRKREVSGLLYLEPGNYLLVPYTFLTKNVTKILPRDHTKYLLRVFHKR